MNAHTSQAEPSRHRGETARLVLPLRPVRAAPHSFPVVATLAPVVGSLVLWAVTRSPYVLVFAMLGPIVAVASVGDTAIQARRALRRERRRFSVEMAEAHATVAHEHERELAALAATYRDARALMRAPRRDPERWRGTLDAELPLVLGSGRRRSTLVIEGEGASARNAERDEWTAPLDALREEANTLLGAPIVADARAGIGVCGPPALAAAAARGIVIQLAAALSPDEHEIVASPGGGTEWVAALPHAVTRTGSTPETVVFRSRRSASRRVLVAVADHAALLPRECRTLLQIDTASAALVAPEPPASAGGSLSPEFVSLEQASAYARVLAEEAAAAGLVAGGGLPDSIALAELVSGDFVPDEDAPADSLACAPAVGAEGPLVVDLVRDGPHAIVGGMTGSGKSELLVAWVLAIAARHGPRAVTFLLVDFKGGSSFHAVQQLPHSVGLITDLDEHSAQRALTSLRAELRYRERELAAAGARSIEELPWEHPLARLVIVVDEFAAMVQGFPGLHELFADIAARGRSLGVHLILCTQRPSGVVRDAVLANCALRVSLRVNNPADSAAVIGTAAAAELPRLPIGRALLSLGGAEPQPAQIAIASEEDAESVARRWADPGWSPRRPWCDPLEPCLPIGELLAGAPDAHLVLGLVDLPQEQRRTRALFDPHEDGSLLVVGGHRSGKSGALAAVVAAAEANRAWPDGSVTVPYGQEHTWDAVTAQLDVVRAGAPAPCLLLLDDLDALIGSLPEDYAFALAEAVSALLREGGRAGTQLVITVRRLGPSLQSIATLCDSRILLRLPSRQEHVAAGGDATEFDAGLTPGAGHWNGHRIQFALAPEGTLERAPRSARGGHAPLRWENSPSWIVVTSRVTELSRRLGGGAREPSLLPAGWELARLGDHADAGLTVTSARGKAVIADVETWQAHWSLFAGLRASIPIIFDGCTPAQFRAITGLRTLPPFIAPGSSSAWLLSPEGEPARVTPPWIPSGTQETLATHE
jgi:S-DNA-T family DNA segregation ATPase FtsK/SpoIIIE